MHAHIRWKVASHRLKLLPTFNEQECIPVACVPYVHCSGCMGVCLGGVCLGGGCLPRGYLPRGGGVCLGGVCLEG